MYDGREDDSTGQIGRREDADRGAVVARQDGTVNGKRNLLDDLGSSGGDGTSDDPVFNNTKISRSAGREISWEQVAEGKVMVSLFQGHRFRQKVPFLQDLDTRGAAGAVPGDWFLGCEGLGEIDLECFQSGRTLLLRDGNAHTPRKQSSRRVGRGAVEDKWGRLDDHVELRAGHSTRNFF